MAKVNYICSNYNRNGKEKCSRHKISEKALNEILLGELQSYIVSMCNYEKVLEHLESLDLNYDTAVAHDKEIAKLREKIIKKVYDNGITVTKDLERYRDGIVFDKVDRLLLVTFIDRILVYENDMVEIIFKYRKEMEKVEGLIDMAKVISKRYG